MADIHERLAFALDNFEAKLKESRDTAIVPDQRWRVPQLIETLSLLASHDSSPVNRSFRTASFKSTLKELSEIATRAAELAQRLCNTKCSVGLARAQLVQSLEDMHETTIFALLDAPWLSATGERAPLNVAYVRRALPHALRDDSIDRARLAAQLDLLAQAAMAAEAPVTIDEGRWPDRRAQAVANLLARFYRATTGLLPTISTVVDKPNEGEHYGPFLDFVRLIFQAMSIEREAYSYAREAAAKLRAAEEKSDP
jgi:hypothetical protein